MIDKHAHNSKLDDLDERSEQIREIMAETPNWIISWGITIVFCSLMAMGIITWVVKYPDIIHAQVSITSTNPPLDINPMASGKLIELYVQDHEEVEKDQHLALIENKAEKEDIIILKEVLKKQKITEDMIELPSFDEEAEYELGSVQGAYDGFMRALEELNNYLEKAPQLKEIKSTRKQILEYKDLLIKLEQHREIYSSELKQMINASDKEKNKARLNLYDVEIKISETKVKIADLDKELIQLANSNDDMSHHARHGLEHSYKNLLESIESWEETNIIKAPVSGKVSFYDYLTLNQEVRSGHPIMTVVPSKRGKIIGVMIMPVTNSAKVAIGQKVNIALNSHPSAEYGSITGTIKQISIVPLNGTHTIEVEIDENLKTSFDKKLEFKENMQGSAEIITEDLRLIERVFYQIRNILVSK